MLRSKSFLQAFLLLLSIVALQASAGAEWSYSGDTAPKAWGKLDPAYILCMKGKQQSPINIADPSLTSKSVLVFHYKPILIYQNRSHKNIYFRTRLSDPGYLTLDKERYNLIGFHFHAPSEHTIAGKHYPKELHFVHENSRKQTLVVAVFIEEGKENKVLEDFIDEAVTKIQNGTGHKLSIFNPAKLLLQPEKHYQYTGSLTTPPCSEGVTWILLATPIQDSAENLKFFKTNIIDDNSRDIQGSNKHLIYKIKE